MTEKQSNENAPNGQGTTNQFPCKLCKQPIEKAVDCVRCRWPAHSRQYSCTTSRVATRCGFTSAAGLAIESRTAWQQI